MAELRLCYIAEPWATGSSVTIASPGSSWLVLDETVTGTSRRTLSQSATAAVTTVSAAITQVTAAAGAATRSMRELNAAWPARYGITPEEAAAVLAAGRREAAERELGRQVADARAVQLLFSVLDADERESWTRRGFIELQGSAGGWWRIRNCGQAGNVDELAAPGGPRIASWCCHPPGGLPDADAQLAQLLQLVTDEPGFRAAGNRTPQRRAAAGVSWAT